MRYTLYRLKSPYGEPKEILLETDNRAEMLQKVTERLNAGEDPALLRMVEDKSIPEPEPVILGGIFD